jgi:hypothetical protein
MELVVTSSVFPPSLNKLPVIVKIKNHSKCFLFQVNFGVFFTASNERRTFEYIDITDWGNFWGRAQVSISIAAIVSNFVPKNKTVFWTPIAKSYYLIIFYTLKTTSTSIGETISLTNISVTNSYVLRKKSSMCPFREGTVWRRSKLCMWQSKYIL